MTASTATTTLWSVIRRALVLGLLGVTSYASAQDESQGERPTPPSIIELGAIELPDGLEHVDSVEVTIEVGPEGQGHVIDCDAPEILCARVGSVIDAARFTPAMHHGAAVSARIRVRLAVAPPQEPAVEVPQTDAGVSPAEVAEVSAFGASGVIDRLTGQPRRLEVVELRDMPGAFGDAYRAIDALPGITPIASGVPYFYLRGSPPNGTLYVYDDIPVPALFHLALGPAVIHPRMVGAVRLHSGVAPARYGRLTGGVVVGEGPPEPTGERIAEVELRLIDVMAFVQAPVGKGTLTMAGRYGYPGLLLSLFSPDLSLAYWDYQARFDYPLSNRDRVQIVWFGSFDKFGDRGGSGTTTLNLQFHRGEVRLIREHGRFELGSALRFGFERSRLDDPDPGDDVSVEATTLGPRLWIAYERPRLRMRFGLNMVVSAGGVDFGERFDEGENVADPGDNPAISGAPGRSVAGAYGEVNWDLHPRVTLEAGLRADVWITAGELEPAADPRLRLIYRPMDGVDMHVAFGLAHQPAVFAIPLPGLTEIPVDLGLQRSIQAEVGVGLDLPADFRLEVQAFLHRYTQLFFTDPFLQAADMCPETLPACRLVRDDLRASGTSYGAELFLRRPPQPGLSGFLSYTLAKTTADPVAGILYYTPSYDVRHVMNLVVSWQHSSGFSAGIRGHLRSGRPVGVRFAADFDVPRLDQVTRRLPVFFRLDAQIGYGWSNRWGRMRVQLQWFNVTIAREPIDLDCERDECDVDYAPALFMPNIGLRAEF